MAQTSRGPVSAYRGQTFRIPFVRGGWVPNPNQDEIPAEGMVEAYNINLHHGGRETRGGTEKVNVTPVGLATGSRERRAASIDTDLPWRGIDPIADGEIGQADRIQTANMYPLGAGGSLVRIMGLIQYRKKNGDEFIVVGTSDGKIYSNYITELKSGLATDKFTNFVVYQDKLYAFNGANRPQVWDGVAGATSDLANIPTDWTGSAWPKAAVVHGRGVSERLWAYGVAGLNQKLYASQDGSDNFADANVTVISIETGDGFGVVGLTTFGGRLIPIGKKRAFLVADDDPDPTKWGYERAQWDGGVAHERLIARTQNDLIVMDESGEIYSIITTQSTGDYEANSLTRPAFVHRWIHDNVNLAEAGLHNAHMIYDPELRAIKVFLPRTGETKCDIVLVYFIDRPPSEAWSKHNYISQDFASVSATVRAGNPHLVKIYTGGYVGHVYRTESEISLDDGVAYPNYFKTPYLTFNNPRSLKRYDRLWIIADPTGFEQISSQIYVDGEAIAGSFGLVDENLNPIVDELGNQILGFIASPFMFQITSPPADPHLLEANHPIGVIGKRIRVEIAETAGGKKMFLSQALIDHIDLGSPAQS